MAEKDDGAWFAPKRFGLGAGLPIAWQGWVLIGGYLALTVAMALTMLPRHGGLFVMIVAILTLALNALAAQHTRGGWHWRWGGDR